jgi:hypothetical protein
LLACREQYTALFRDAIARQQRYNARTLEEAGFAFSIREGHMKGLPNILLGLAGVALAIGLVVRIYQTVMGVVPLIILDPLFYWRGAMALIGLAMVIVLIQIRDK